MRRAPVENTKTLTPPCTVIPHKSSISRELSLLGTAVSPQQVLGVCFSQKEHSEHTLEHRQQNATRALGHSNGQHKFPFSEITAAPGTAEAGKDQSTSHGSLIAKCQTGRRRTKFELEIRKHLAHKQQVIAHPEER